MSVVTVEERGPVSIIRINRPEKLNAISAAVAVELQCAFQAFDAAAQQRVAVLSAVGDRAFTAGADVSDLPELWRAIPGVGFQTDKPIIAATSGWCVGGGIVLVMMCDLMVSAESTVFYYPEAKLGVTGGMISSLVTRMPHKLAMEMMLLCSKVPAQRAYDVGFVNKVVPNGTHEAEAVAMAEQMLESAPLVMGALKRLAAEAMPVGPVERMVAVSQTLARVRASEDLQEGIRAHKERRQPVFRGR
ncbi:MAG TPA: enoyl-CoA hydratase-related protein [Acetobacteraceae bacterium]|nr:enoyl-CoA hydratase-related protein [Acetobacteraceae bacterium]